MVDENKNKHPKKQKPIGADGHRSRMRHRLMTTPLNEFEERDAIEMLLYHSIKRRDTRDIAVNLMENFENNATNIILTPYKQLTKYDGIGESSATLLSLVGRIVQTSLKPKIDLRPTYTESDLIRELFLSIWDNVLNDELWAVCFDDEMHAKDIRILCSGKDFGDYQHMLYEICRFCSVNNSYKVALARFSCLDNSYPMKSDFELCVEVRKIFRFLGYTLCDHYITSYEKCDSILNMVI